MIQRTVRTLSLLALGASGALSGCAPSDDDEVAEHDVLAQLGAIDGGVAASSGSDGGMLNTPCGPQYPHYSPGLAQKFGDLTVKVLSASPAPPRLLAVNDWVIQVLDAAGQPLAGVQLRGADTGMLAHGHDGLFRPSVFVLEQPGQFRLHDLSFSMRGPWEVSFNLLPPGATRETEVSFLICI